MAPTEALLIGLVTLAALPDVTRSVLRSRRRPLAFAPRLVADEPRPEEADLARAG